MSSEVRKKVLESYKSSPKYSEIKAGLPEDFKDIKTLGDLLSINYKLLNVREQLRLNLISKLKGNEKRYPGIIGFEEDVAPALDRAILSGHDIFLIGQIGQAKTKIVEIISENLLSPIPVVQGSVTNDCPMELPSENLIALLEDKDLVGGYPEFFISPESIEKIRNNGESTQIDWIEGKQRFKYVLATPDISVKDLVGYIDAIKVAKKGVEIYQIDSYSPGQLMQAKNGIFCLDELPVLDPRKQVALLSVLQDGKFTTGSFPVIFKPRTAFFATANPVDYTHSGKVIEPLYDRLKSHIHTHYPNSIEDEMLIIIQEAKIPKSFVGVSILKSLAQLIQNTRKQDEINQERGVSVRLGIHGLEILVGEADRTRGIHHKIFPSPRLSDLNCLEQIAKFELAEVDDSIENRSKIFKKLLSETIKKICKQYVDTLDSTAIEQIKKEFVGNKFQVSQEHIWKNGSFSYHNQLEKFPSLSKLIESKFSLIAEEQKKFLDNVISEKIFSGNLEQIEENSDEVKSNLTEMILEGLCWTDSPVLEKKEEGYVSA